MFKKKAFTLVELLVAMAIIAVLIGLAIGAITLAQRVSRDTQRRQGVADLAAALNAYYAQNSGYPAETAVNISGSDIDVAGIPVRLNGAASAVETDYCYNLVAGGGYVVGAILEDGIFVQNTDLNDATPETTCQNNLIN